VAALTQNGFHWSISRRHPAHIARFAIWPARLLRRYRKSGLPLIARRWFHIPLRALLV